jgi:protein TonB
MKKIILLAACLAFSILSFSQKVKIEEDKFYMLDANFKGTTQEHAKYFIRVAKQNDSCWRFDTYNITGPLISTEHYKDEQGKIMHGQSVYFNKKGTPDSILHFVNNLADGPWYYFNDTGKVFLQKDFVKGHLTATIDRIKKDSVNEIEYKKRDTSKMVEEESSFQGGLRAWAKYLTDNMVYPDRAQKIERQGSVILQFIVDTDGMVVEPEIIQSVEFSLDEEAMRMIKGSPKWKPAFQNGKKVKSYKKQPITFRLTTP